MFATVAGKQLEIKPGAPEIALLCRAIFRASFADDEDEAVVNEKYSEWPEDQAKAIRAAKFVLRALGGNGAVVKSLRTQGQDELREAAMKLLTAWETVDESGMDDADCDAISECLLAINAALNGGEA